MGCLAASPFKVQAEAGELLPELKVRLGTDACNEARPLMLKWPSEIESPAAR